MTGRRVVIAVAGNPNCGKTTIFNAITGAHHKVGNYPGVTVEKREGHRKHKGVDIKLVDLPGTYSLSAYSLDEMVARDFLLDERPDVVIDVMDSGNLERHLYLCMQFRELGVPVVGALNMADEAEAAGVSVDADRLSSILGMPLVRTVGPRGEGVDALLDAALTAADGGGLNPERRMDYGPELEARLEPLVKAIEADPGFAERFPPRWLAVKLIEKDADAMERLAGHSGEKDIRDMAAASVAWVEKHFGKDSEIVVSEQRYAYVHGAARESVRRVPRSRETVTENIDKVLMNRYLGLPIFGLVMWGLFELTFALGSYPVAWLESGFAWLGQAAGSILPDGRFASLVVDGIIGGVGGVLSFVPLIIILFFFLSILEDVGYMARAAFITDKFLHAFGLHGQSFLPLILGFGCSVPAIMATRTLKSPRDRIVTAMAIPFMSCGAKLPVYVLLAGAFFPQRPGGAVMAIYGVGVLLALGSAFLWRRTILRGDSAPFVMELPPYRAPTLRGLLWHVGEKTLQYAQKAGTVILAASILIWALTAFPELPDDAARDAAWAASYSAAEPAAGPEAVAAAVESQRAKAGLEFSMAGRLGKAIEPLVRPLGLDWRSGVAVVTGFAAKEVVVSTLGVMYAASESGEGQSLTEALRADPNFTPLTALVLMLFILTIPPCFAALGALKAELGWKWLGFAVAYMLVVGWVLSFGLRMFGLAFGLWS